MRTNSFIFLLSCFTVASGFFRSDINTYKDFRIKKNIQVTKYEKVEDNFKKGYECFKENINYINKHNQKNSSYVLNTNNFVDEDYEKLKSTFFNTKFPITKKMNIQIEKQSCTVFSNNINKKIDWVKRNKVTPVKNQGSCGSCWAFSAVGAIESKIAIDGHSIKNLSEQMVLDCSMLNYGCNGGFMHTAFDDIMKMGGISKESEYPYIAFKKQCNLNVSREEGTNIMGYNFVLSHSINALKNAVQKQPVCIALAGDSKDFLFYGGGILDNQNLSTEINHAVLLVGYNEEAEIPYWIIKNSWGEQWGEKGYIRIKMSNGTGIVGMNQYGVYPF